MKLTRRKVLYIIFAVLFLLVATRFFRAVEQQGAVLTFPKGGQVFLSIADNPEERLVGLFVLDELPEHQGMLFIFDDGEEQRTWTRHYDFSVDLLWLSDRFEVLDMVEDIAPCRKDPCTLYRPSKGLARYAIQLAAGQIRRQGVEVGKQLRLGLFSG